MSLYNIARQVIFKTKSKSSAMVKYLNNIHGLLNHIKCKMAIKHWCYTTPSLYVHKLCEVVKMCLLNQPPLSQLLTPKGGTS